MIGYDTLYNMHLTKMNNFQPLAAMLEVAVNWAIAAIIIKFTTHCSGGRRDVTVTSVVICLPC